MDAIVPSYKGFRFPVEIISHCVWLYHRFPLSFREGVTPVPTDVPRSSWVLLSGR